MDKKELRKEILARRNALSQIERREKSEQIAKRVFAMQEFQKANVLLLYRAIRSEVETEQIFATANQLGKKVYCPRVIGNRMEFYFADNATEYEISKFGICEPKIVDEKCYIPKAKDRVLVLMPGAVYDKVGNRIGYGGGYYDKYLHGLIEEPVVEWVCKIGLAYECQLVENGVIERELHDVNADYIVTEISFYKEEV